jgi:hypothetical protein
MNISDDAAKRVAPAVFQAIREDGLMIVPSSPTGSMIKAARRAAADLTDDQIENIYFLMTNAWLTSLKEVGNG